MKTTIKEKICADCGRVFFAENGRPRLCSECQEHKFRSVRRRMQKSKPVMSIPQVSRIEKIYNKVHGTFKHYGEIVTIIDGTPPDRCVCCGEVIPEGRMVCPSCEKKGSRCL